jgi:hypothetical protein
MNAFIAGGKHFALTKVCNTQKQTELLRDLVIEPSRQKIVPMQRTASLADSFSDLFLR